MIDVFDLQNLLFWRPLRLHQDPSKIKLRQVLQQVSKKPLPQLAGLMPQVLKQIFAILDSPDVRSTIPYGRSLSCPSTQRDIHHGDMKSAWKLMSYFRFCLDRFPEHLRLPTITRLLSELCRRCLLT
jgi:hypothetical protein